MTPEEILDHYRRRPFSSGCGDHSCRVKAPTGMGTNGGCRCFGRGGWYEGAAMLDALCAELERRKEGEA